MSKYLSQRISVNSNKTVTKCPTLSLEIGQFHETFPQPILNRNL